jgi:ABC-type transport system substrate-binding protein
LNMGIDRAALVREALNGHGLVSTGPVWVRNYAYRPDSPKFEFNSSAAANAAHTQPPGAGSGALQFTCLIPPDAVYERLALVIKKQLAGAGIEMILQEASQDQIYELLRNRKFEAALIEGVSGPTLLRPYQFWHSKGAVNAGGLGSPVIDEAFDRVRRSKTEDEYLQRVAELQQTFVDDPPGVLLAWSERVRAVSKRFVVPTQEPGRDIVRTMRLWTPTTMEQRTSHN